MRLEELEGPGLTVTLDDAPDEVLASAGDAVNIKLRFDDKYMDMAAKGEL